MELWYNAIIAFIKSDSAGDTEMQSILSNGRVSGLVCSSTVGLGRPNFAMDRR